MRIGIELRAESHRIFVTCDNSLLISSGEACPKEGPLFDEKIRLRKEVKKKIRYCAAQAENRRLLKRDQMFTR